MFFQSGHLIICYCHFYLNSRIHLRISYSFPAKEFNWINGKLQLSSLSLIILVYFIFFQNYRGRLNHMNTPDFVREFEEEHQGSIPLSSSEDMSCKSVFVL